ncbi:SREC-like protein, partial [Mya arenaria]
MATCMFVLFDTFYSLTCARDGTCSGGCKAGYYGAECDRQCDACLSKECEASSGVCSIGCIPGYYGNMCQTRCPTNCVECERTSGKYIIFSIVIKQQPWSKYTCHRVLHCISGARNVTCKRRDCTSCISTFYGLPRCDIVCNANCLPGLGRQCDQSTGKCVHGCHGGFYGDDCQESCGQCASGVCGTNGACNGCNVGYYGSKCTLTCSDNCESAASGRPCAQTNGFCSNGCRPGYFGDACSVQCPARLDPQAFIALTTSNLHFDVRILFPCRCSPAFCVRSTGDCGTCQEGYYGPKCDNACNNCFESRCSSVNGDCTSGCTVGKYGSKCNTDCKSTCNDGSCDQTSGQCE